MISLEMNNGAVWICPWRPWLSKFEDVLGGLYERGQSQDSQCRGGRLESRYDMGWVSIYDVSPNPGNVWTVDFTFKLWKSWLEVVIQKIDEHTRNWKSEYMLTYNCKNNGRLAGRQYIARVCCTPYSVIIMVWRNREGYHHFGIHQ